MSYVNTREGGIISTSWVRCCHLRPWNNVLKSSLFGHLRSYSEFVSQNLNCIGWIHSYTQTGFYIKTILYPNLRNVYVFVAVVLFRNRKCALRQGSDQSSAQYWTFRSMRETRQILCMWLNGIWRHICFIFRHHHCTDSPVVLLWNVSAKYSRTQVPTDATTGVSWVISRPMCAIIPEFTL